MLGSLCIEAQRDHCVKEVMGSPSMAKESCWGQAGVPAWTFVQRGYCVKLQNWSLGCLKDPKRLEMPELWDTCWGELLTRNGNNLEERSVLQRTKLKGVGDLKSILTSDAEFVVGPAGFQSCFHPVFPHCVSFPMFWNSNVHPMPLNVGSMKSVFSFWFYRGLQLRDCMNLRKDLEFQTFKHC